ncbi:MAG: FAD-binding protein [Clostridiales bacterium]|nr:FAD-binding protein [Clostridiales bacterium]MDO4350241.1 FAD-binding protein [Eubacteriales bacterium]MDY4009807.1 FAD-binding protein [Candidatus Limiplasma sp.]
MGKKPAFHAVQTLVVGSGAAGLNAAVALKKRGVTNVAVLTEGMKMGTSRNTGSDKQTYYKLTTAGEREDSVRRMARTLSAGGAMDGDLALAEAAGSLRAFFHLVEIGVPFPVSAYGEYVGYKTDHDPLQRGTSAGPLTSRYMTEMLEREAAVLGVTVFDGYQVIELLTEGGRVRGLVALMVRGEEAGRYAVFSAENIVYATGGEAGMYEASVYPGSQTGGSGPAFRAGAMGKNLTESQYGIASIQFRWNLSGTFQQVLPRYMSTDLEGGDEREFLDGYFDTPEQMLQAIFLKGYQWPFDPRKADKHGSSLIDILVYQETMLRGRRVWLDFRRNPACMQGRGLALVTGEAREYLENSGAMQPTPVERLRHMNPAAIELYREHGIELEKEPLEIAVCAQHNNGGLAGNAWWESNLRHLFPVGEVNGSHGVYRPGGSALNAGQVGSARAAEYIAHCYGGDPLEREALMVRCGAQVEAAIRLGQEALSRQGDPLDLAQERKALGRRMSLYGAHIRSAEGVRRALGELEEQERRLLNGRVPSERALPAWYRLRDLMLSQRMYLSAILDYITRGGGSRGSYLISDGAGELPLEGLDERFRYTLDGEAHSGVIQEAIWKDGACQCAWRPVRPIPEGDLWFENVWRDWRENKIYGGERNE